MIRGGSKVAQGGNILAKMSRDRKEPSRETEGKQGKAGGSLRRRKEVDGRDEVRGL